MAETSQGKQAYFPTLPSETGKIDSYQRCWSACQRWMKSIDHEHEGHQQRQQASLALPLVEFLDDLQKTTLTAHSDGQSTSGPSPRSIVQRKFLMALHWL
ncbi:hypothetical protein SV7mr_25840 [Stieleria bergensis]|uniref:Uncharacterized protein n=1 Tax=Stieleria bergensis TaxID=2528025 RepID=A0A517SVA4_9BACT|nr:hypothetical protein SV7mr_25840 [Planctomycetes bacterium SV_7m_r]